jgi:hypothetical protein
MRTVEIAAPTTRAVSKGEMLFCDVMCDSCYV